MTGRTLGRRNAAPVQSTELDLFSQTLTPDEGNKRGLLYKRRDRLARAHRRRRAAVSHSSLTSPGPNSLAAPLRRIWSYGKDARGLMKGKVDWRFLIGFASAVSRSQPS